MALNEEQVDWLQRLLQDCEDQESRLSDWERNFVDDQRSRLEQYGEHMILSPKQFEVLRKIEGKISG